MVLGEDDGVVGFVKVGPTRDEHQDPECVGEIHALYLLPESWGEGLGRQLLAAAVERLAAAGFEEATLWVLGSNVRARRFYEAGGWFADGASKTDDRKGFRLVEERYRRALP